MSSATFKRTVHTVHVTREIMSRSARGDQQHCAIANALIELGLDCRHVDNRRIDIFPHSFAMPKTLRDWVAAWDEGNDSIEVCFTLVCVRNFGETSYTIADLQFINVAPPPQKQPVQRIATQQRQLPQPTTIEVSNDGIYWFAIENEVHHKS